MFPALYPHSGEGQGEARKGVMERPRELREEAGLVGVGAGTEKVGVRVGVGATAGCETTDLVLGK